MSHDHLVEHIHTDHNQLEQIAQDHAQSASEKSLVVSCLLSLIIYLYTLIRSLTSLFSNLNNLSSLSLSQHVDTL